VHVCRIYFTLVIREHRVVTTQTTGSETENAMCLSCTSKMGLKDGAQKGGGKSHSHIPRTPNDGQSVTVTGLKLKTVPAPLLGTAEAVLLIIWAKVLCAPTTSCQAYVSVTQYDTS
jgi:hypothetical protein